MARKKKLYKTGDSITLRLRQGDEQIANWINQQPRIQEAIFSAIQDKIHVSSMLQEINNRLDRVERLLQGKSTLCEPAAESPFHAPDELVENLQPDQQGRSETEEEIKPDDEAIDLAMSMFDLD